ncbi:MAG: hypothetical protein ACKOEX_01200 [Planctomycetia bacterium]
MPVGFQHRRRLVKPRFTRVAEFFCACVVSYGLLAARGQAGTPFDGEGSPDGGLILGDAQRGTPGPGAVAGGDWPQPLPPVDAQAGGVDEAAAAGATGGELLVLDAFDIPPPRDAEMLPAPIRGPPILGDPVDNPYDMAGERPVADPLFSYPIYPTPGFAGATSVLPSEHQENSHFVPMEDRWRIGSPPWDRYGRGHPRLDDYPYALGNGFNPYTQNFLKEDFPVIGQHTFLDIKGISRTITNFRQVPTPDTPFESTPTPGQEDFFGDPNGFLLLQYYTLSFELNHGDKTFKPNDWRLKIAPVFNQNYLEVYENGVVLPDVSKGTRRYRTFASLEEWFIEAKLADLSPDYDFMSIRGGSQPFTSDFRGFIFSDLNRAIRLFGTQFANRDQFNIILFDQREKDTNSFLNTFDDRGQNILIANYYRQDFIWPGHTVQTSFHYDFDQPSVKYDKNGFLVRPDPVGLAEPHEVNAFYFGVANDGHINELNISSAFYYVIGRDSLNPQALQPVDIGATMAAVELSYSPDWVRFRTSFFFASGDNDINDNKGGGFDGIIDNTQFAGGEFSFWVRQQIKLLGTNLKNLLSIYPDLRASNKFQSQANFVNPGLQLYNAGVDFELTQRTRLVTNCNFLFFDTTNVLESFVFQDNISKSIGTDLSLGVESRPLLNNNWIFRAGVSGLIVGEGFQQLYGNIDNNIPNLFAAFTDLELAF